MAKSYEDQMRREMEQAAAQEQICPVEEEIDAALSSVVEKTHKYKGPAMKAPHPAKFKKGMRGLMGPVKNRKSKRVSRGDVNN